MIDLFTQKAFYGNSILIWTLAALCIISSIIIGKILYWIISKTIKVFARKTKNKLDDIIVDMTEEPLVMIGVLIMLWLSINILTLSELAQKWTHNIFYMLIVVNVAWLISRLFNSILHNYIEPLTKKSKTDLDDVLLPILKKTATILIWALAIIIGLNNAGYEISALLASLGIAGLAVAMASREILSNVFGGLVILITRPFKAGDDVMVDSIHGVVKSIGIRSTILTNLNNGADVTIPNKRFNDTNVTNLDTRDEYWISSHLNLDLSSDHTEIEHAISIINDIPKKIKALQPSIYVGLDEITLTSFKINYIYAIQKLSIDESDHFIDHDAKITKTKSLVNLHILSNLSKSKIKIAQPYKLEVTH